MLMDFDEAMAAHTKWKMSFLQGIRGHGQRPEAAEIARVDLCDLGVWLAAEGVQYASYPSHAEVLTAHADFHQRAADVARTLKGGDAEGAEAMLAAGRPYALASESVFLAVAKFRAHLKQHPPRT
jgi:hypothetical protein